MAGLVPLDKPPAVLADRAQQIIASLGYTDRIADSASNLATSYPYITWLAANDQRPDRWNALKKGSPATLLFWYRTSPRPLIANRTQSQVTVADPPLNISGMTLVMLDTLGRLQEFHAVPPQFDAATTPAPPPRWDALFDAAGLQMASFSSVTPQWTPRGFADTRAAWEGPLTDRPEYRVRLEAAAYRGRPVSMLMVGPWLRPLRMEAATQTASQVVLRGAVALLIVALVVTALLIARHNLQANVGALTGSGALASLMIDQTVGGIFVGMFAVLGYVLLRLALRRTSLAIAAAVVLLALVQAQSVLTSGAPLWMAVLFQIGIIGIITMVVVR